MKIVAVAMLLTVTLAAQRPQFDVASIRENRSARFETFLYRYPASGRLVIINHPVRQMIQIAYNVREFQLEGGSGWLGETRYDIEAKAGNPVSSSQVTAMFQSLLEDRFRLVIRRTTREGQVLALVRANADRLGPNITPAKPEDARMNPIGLVPGQGTRGSAATMADLADFLSNRMGRHVVDRTGLTGIYNFTMQSGGVGIGARGRPPGLPSDALPPPRDDLPALPTALQEQLGLRLESQQGMIPILVIERVERPAVDGYSSTAEPVSAEVPGR